MHDFSPFEPQRLENELAFIMRNQGNVLSRDISPDIQEWLQDYELSIVDSSDSNDVRVVLEENGWRDAYSRLGQALTIDIFHSKDQEVVNNVINFVNDKLPDALEVWFYGQRTNGEYFDKSTWNFMIFLEGDSVPGSVHLLCHNHCRTENLLNIGLAVKNDLKWAGSAPDWAVSEGIRLWKNPALNLDDNISIKL